MARHVNIRRRLLKAVDMMLSQDAATNNRGHELARALSRRRQPPFATLDYLILGGITSYLIDSIFYDDPDFMRELRETLAHGSSKIHRLYLNYDFHEMFTEIEATWCERLQLLTEFLGLFPFDDRDHEEVIEEHQQHMDTTSHLIIGDTLVPKEGRGYGPDERAMGGT